MPLTDVDRRLLDRCLKHEPGAWHEFVDRYAGLIYHVIQHVGHARSLVFSVEDMEDLAAEVFKRIVDHDYAVLRNFQGKSSLPTYLAVIARRVSIRAVVQRQREAELGHSTAHRASLEDFPYEVEPTLPADEVERLLRVLSDRDAEVVRMYHLKQMSYRQIGQRLSIPESSVGPILSKARRKLRQADRRDLE